MTSLSRAAASICGLVTDKDTDASGEQVKHEPKKSTITNARLSKAIELIVEGKYTKEELLNKFALTEGQIELMENV